jgi:hypothetical protein
MKDKLPFEETYEIMKVNRKAVSAEGIGVRWAAVRRNWCGRARLEMRNDMV